MNSKNLLLSTAALILAMGISLLFFGINYERPREILLFYPNQITGESGGEMRTILYTRNKKENVYRVVEQNITSPTQQKHRRITHQDTGIRAFYMEDNDVIIDFTGEILFNDRNNTSNPDRTFYFVEKTIRHSFREVENISFAIQGVPYEYDPLKLLPEVSLPSPVNLPLLKPGREPESSPVERVDE